MTPFADLLERLAFTPGRNGKLTLLRQYFATTPDPDRGWALAALAGTLDLPHVTSSVIKGLMEEAMDPHLFALSRAYVGDLAETVSLLWPEPDRANPPSLDEVVTSLLAASRSDRPAVLARLLDRCGASARLALIKLCTGGMRVGVSTRLAQTALADTNHPLETIERLWFAIDPPYTELFAWLDGGAMPDVDLSLAYRPMMLAHPVEDRVSTLSPAEHVAEWKWDGIRVQAVATPRGRRLYTRTGDDISKSFPDILAQMDYHGCLDGELLVVRDGEVAPFADLQKRLGRKRVGKKTLADYPAHVRAYDLLDIDGIDLRDLPWSERRARLDRMDLPERFDLSPLIPFDQWDALEALRDGARGEALEGLMLKRRDSAYVAGRPVGQWWKWKRDPLEADCVMMYAQRGHGKRSSYYSDYTFGAWTDGPDGPVLTPVGKAYSGFTDQELTELDRFVRNNFTQRFGPVRAVKPALVLEIAFDAIQESKRHKSGVAMRFPRIKRIRWDKPIEEAATLESLKAMIG
ncbi:cisplatin damage response ATP-dependent DNA ligase [Pontivivens insulae]|uniref:DNA ligase (ATP) n=1 Tax=Pontivivens insulae TaxID=1639689 RepID=A0A2R8ADN4_9RHOB|nr:cisplatin damage response ATP-dependent DNA ligase [Pontivivens insulae]RED14197.1 DNA ligase-1 [Pontivivens insulae]SPF30272.1 DNA ligase B [Pontivivens insulae]